MYIETGILTKNQLADSQHIAIASIEKVDVIVSWNFKHIVNLKKIHGYNSVNIREGYQILEIRSPPLGRCWMKNKNFDAVKMMREIRDDLSRKYSKMTIEEQIKDLNIKFSEIQRENLPQDKTTVNK